MNSSMSRWLPASRSELSCSLAPWPNARPEVSPRPAGFSRSSTSSSACVATPILVAALAPGAAQPLSVYSWRQTQALNFGILRTGAQVTGLLATGFDYYSAGANFAAGNAGQGTLDLVSAGLGTGMLVQPELTPILLPALAVAKVAPITQKYMNEASCNGQIVILNPLP
jgi:hypothetical protein